MPFANNFTPGSAREIARTVEKVRMLFPPSPTGGSNATVPLWLAKTTAPHSQGASQDVTLMTGAKGAEVARTGDTVSAYARYQAYDDDEEVIVGLIGEGWEILCPGTSSSMTGIGGCDCSTCLPSRYATIDFGAALLGMEKYALTIYNTSTDTDTRFIQWKGSYWESDDITFECDASVSLTVRYKLTASSTDQGAMLLEMIDQAGPTTLLSWVNYSQGWVPTCSITLGIVPQPTDCAALDPPPCKVCVTPSLTGGCACNGLPYVMLVDFGSLDLSTCSLPCVGAGFATVALGEQLLEFETGSTISCWWTKYSPDGLYRYRLAFAGDGNIPTLHTSVGISIYYYCSTSSAWFAFATWFYTISPHARYCDRDSYTLDPATIAGSPSTCAPLGSTVTVTPLLA